MSNGVNNSENRVTTVGESPHKPAPAQSAPTGTVNAPHKDRADKPQGNAQKKPLVAVLFDTALKYEGIDFTTREDEGKVVFSWEKNTEEDKVIYVVTVNPDSTFSTSAKVNSINTTRTLNFNNKDESQNILAHAIKALAKNNETN